MSKGSFFFDEPKALTDKGTGPSTQDPKPSASDDDGLWSQILKGESGSAKTTVLEAIRNPVGALGDQDPGTQLALTYSFFDLLDEDAEEPAARIGLYELSKTLANSLVLLCLDWTKPCDSFISDGTVMLERDYSYSDDQFDFIQQSLRTMSLKYGASLFYVSTHRPATLTTLRSYVLHRLLWKTGSPLYVVDRDTIRVPAGWDSWGMIRVQRDGFNCEALAGQESGSSPDYEKELARGKSIYEGEVKVPEIDKSFTMSNTIAAEDEQVFLERNMDLLSSMSGALSGTASPLTTNMTDGMASRLTNGASTMSSNDMLEDVSQKLARLAKLKVSALSVTCENTHFLLRLFPHRARATAANGVSPASQNESSAAAPSGRSASVSGTRAASQSMSLGGGGSSHGGVGASSPHGSPPSGSPKS
ncbi:dynein light intermediate chain-domain-containing protein [Chytridium lagenaria]|nr:dynein light intermediate chain-domain-containing protein [Chytridium lagenaria]